MVRSPVMVTSVFVASFNSVAPEIPVSLNVALGYFAVFRNFSLFMSLSRREIPLLRVERSTLTAALGFCETFIGSIITFASTFREVPTIFSKGASVVNTAVFLWSLVVVLNVVVCAFAFEQVPKLQI